MKNGKSKKKNFILFTLALIVIPTIIISLHFVSAIDIDSCQTLSSPNTLYQLNQSIVNNGLLGNCLIVSGVNVTIDCLGYSLSSINNVSGIFSNVRNTTVKNCNISMGGGLVVNTNAKGIYIDALEGTIINNTIFVSNGYGMHLLSNSKRVYNNSVRSIASLGILFSASANSYFYNNNLSSVSNIGLQVINGINNTFVLNSVASNVSYATYFQGSINNTLVNHFSKGYFSGSYGIVFTSLSKNNIVKDSEQISGFNNDVYVSGTSINNTFLNCSYNATKEQVDSGSQLFRKWYYRGYSNNTLGVPISNVNVSVYDRFNVLRFFDSTNVSGFTSLYEILDYESISGVKNFSSNYTMFANFSSNSLQRSENISLQTNNLADTFSFVISPFINFLSQNPSDVNSFNILSNSLKINYSILNGTNPLNQSTIFIYYKTNKTDSDVTYFINGTAFNGFQNALYSSNISDNYTFRIFDNQVYPATYNFNEVLMENTSHTLQSLTTGSDYASVELLNVSNSSQYSFLEMMVNRTTGIQPLRYYYCNSSYVFGVSNSPDLNSNCVLFFSDSDGNYNHTHSQYSSHKIASFPINTTTGTISGIKITSTSYFMIRGASNWQYYYINHTSRTNAIRTTSNNAVSWVSQNFTIDSHLHQFGGNDTLWYYVCANDTLNNMLCSSVRNDLMDLGGLPPSSPIIYSPINTYYKNGLSINYTSSISPNNYAVNFYNITLLNSTFSFNKTIVANNSNNLSYLYNTLLSNDGFYIIKITACDINGLCSDGFSNVFGIDNTPPFADLIDPANNSFVFDHTVNFTVNVTDNSSLQNITLVIQYLNGTNLSQSTTNVNGTQGVFGTVYTFLTNGIFRWFYIVYDTAGNFFQTIARIINVISVPTAIISFPVNNTNYTFFINHLDYDIEFADYCWYSLDDGFTNITIPCGFNSVTGILSMNGTNDWSVSGNNSLNNITTAKVTFDSVCSNIVPDILLDSYPYVDFNSTYHIKITSFIVGNSQLNILINGTVFNLVYDNVSSYNIAIIFSNVGDYPFTIFGDGVCPTIEQNVSGTFKVRQPFYLTVEGFVSKDNGSIFFSNKYINNFAYVTAELKGNTKIDNNIEPFFSPLIKANVFIKPAFFSTYTNGVATLKIYEPNQTYVLRLIDGEINFDSGYAKPNVTKSYGTNIYLGQQYLNGTNRTLAVLLTDKDIHPYRWLFTWIMAIVIIGSVVIAMFLFFMIPNYPWIAIGFVLIFTMGSIIIRIGLWFFLGQ